MKHATTTLTLTVVGEGLRIWIECLARSAQPAPQPAPRGPRYESPTVYLPRRGQGIFRIEVLDAYQRACAITRQHSLVVLEAGTFGRTPMAESTMSAMASHCVPISTGSLIVVT